jgi:hypothetical protein
MYRFPNLEVCLATISRLKQREYVRSLTEFHRSACRAVRLHDLMTVNATGANALLYAARSVGVQSLTDRLGLLLGMIKGRVTEWNLGQCCITVEALQQELPRLQRTATAIMFQSERTAA